MSLRKSICSLRTSNRCRKSQNSAAENSNAAGRNEGEKPILSTGNSNEEAREAERRMIIHFSNALKDFFRSKAALGKASCAMIEPKIAIMR